MEWLEEACPNRFAERPSQRLVVQCRGIPQDRVRRAATDDRRDTKNRAGVLRERLDLRRRRCGDRRRKVRAGIGGRSQLLREEWITFGTLADRGEQRRRRRAAEDPGELLSELRLVEGSDRERRDTRPSQQLTERRPEGLVGVRGLRPIRPDHEQIGFSSNLHEIQQEGLAGPVGPVDILELENDRRRRPSAVDDIDQPIEQLGLGKAGHCGVRIVDLRRPRELGEDASEDGSVRPDELLLLARVEAKKEPAECLDDRGVGGSGLAEIEAGADGDPHAASGGLLVPGLEQAGLADAGIAADQHRRHVAARRPIQGVIECSKFRGPADEGRACDATHGRIIGPYDLGTVRQEGSPTFVSCTTAVRIVAAVSPCERADRARQCERPSPRTASQPRRAGRDARPGDGVPPRPQRRDRSARRSSSAG